MEQTRYQALFYGELKENHSKEMALRSLAGAYQKDDDFFETWFTDEKTVVKKDATHEEAKYIRDYLGDLGLVIKIEPIGHVKEVVEKIENVEKSSEQFLEEAFSQIQQTFKNVQEQAASPEKVLIKIQPAPMGKRLIAYLIDLIICMIAANLLLEIILAPLGLINTALIHELSLAANNASTQNEVRSIIDSYMGNDEFASLVIQVLFFVFLIQVIYFGVLDGKYNGTFGKKLFKIKLYSLIGSRMTLKQAALRQVLMIIAFFILSVFFNIIGLLILVGIFIMGAYDKRRLNQTIFDRFTKVVVGTDQSKG